MKCRGRLPPDAEGRFRRLRGKRPGGPRCDPPLVQRCAPRRVYCWLVQFGGPRTTVGTRKKILLFERTFPISFGCFFFEINHLQTQVRAFLRLDSPNPVFCPSGRGSTPPRGRGSKTPPLNTLPSPLAFAGFYTLMLQYC